jgi:hypothetical protein
MILVKFRELALESVPKVIEIITMTYKRHMPALKNDQNVVSLDDDHQCHHHHH